LSIGFSGVLSEQRSHRLRNNFAKRLSGPLDKSFIDRYTIHAVDKPVELGVLKHEGPITFHHNNSCAPTIGGQPLRESCFKLPERINGNLR